MQKRFQPKHCSPNSKILPKRILPSSFHSHSNPPEPVRSPNKSISCAAQVQNEQQPLRIGHFDHHHQQTTNHAFNTRSRNHKQQTKEIELPILATSLQINSNKQRDFHMGQMDSRNKQNKKHGDRPRQGLLGLYSKKVSLLSSSRLAQFKIESPASKSPEKLNQSHHTPEPQQNLPANPQSSPKPENVKFQVVSKKESLNYDVRLKFASYSGLFPGRSSNSSPMHQTFKKGSALMSKDQKSVWPLARLQQYRTIENKLLKLNELLELSDSYTKDSKQELTPVMVASMIQFYNLVRTCSLKVLDRVNQKHPVIFRKIFKIVTTIKNKNWNPADQKRRVGTLNLKESLPVIGGHELQSLSDCGILNIKQASPQHVKATGNLNKSEHLSIKQSLNSSTQANHMSSSHQTSAHNRFSQSNNNTSYGLKERDLNKDSKSRIQSLSNFYGNKSLTDNNTNYMLNYRQQGRNSAKSTNSRKVHGINKNKSQLKSKKKFNSVRRSINKHLKNNKSGNLGHSETIKLLPSASAFNSVQVSEEEEESQSVSDSYTTLTSKAKLTQKNSTIKISQTDISNTALDQVSSSAADAGSQLRNKGNHKNPGTKGKVTNPIDENWLANAVPLQKIIIDDETQIGQNDLGDTQQSAYRIRRSSRSSDYSEGSYQLPAGWTSKFSGSHFLQRIKHRPFGRAWRNQVAQKLREIQNRERQLEAERRNAFRMLDGNQQIQCKKEEVDKWILLQFSIERQSK